LSIQGLWAGPWLRDVIGLTRADAAALLFWVAVSMIIGWIVSGWSAGRLAARGLPLMTTTVSYVFIFIILQILVMIVPVSWNTLIWCLFGFVGVTPIIAYAALSQFFPLNLSGRVTTGVNLLVFVAAFSGQWVIGAIIQLWPIGADGRYHVQGFRYGFSLMIALQIAALGWYFLAGRIIKTKQQEKNETP
jgi:MFS family permease